MSKIHTYLQAVNQTLRNEIKNDDKVIFMGEDIGIMGGAFGASKGLLEEFGQDRIIETPISENSLTGLATGAAMLGLRPIVEFMYMDFMALAADQIANHLSKIHYIYGGEVTVPVTIRVTTGGNCRYGASHSQCLEAWFKHVPGLKIAAPSNAQDVKWLLQFAVRDDNPWLIIESRKLYNTSCLVTEKSDIPVGKAKVLQTGKDLTLVSYSRMVPECQEVAKKLLDEKDIEVELIDLRTLNPLDYDSIYSSIKKTGKIIIVHEAYTTCGVGAEIVARVTENCLSSLVIPPLRIGTIDTPIPASPVLEDHNVPAAENIFNNICEHLGKHY